MPFHLVLFCLFVAGLALIAVAMTGYGSPDRTHEKPPRLPGHDVQDQLDRRRDPNQP